MYKPTAKNLSHLLSEEAKSREESPLWAAIKYFNQPGMTFLGSGLPLSDHFPFEKISIDVSEPSFMNRIGTRVTDGSKTVFEVHKDTHKNEKDTIELARSLQYGHTGGHSEILTFLREHIEQIHKVPYKDWDVIATVGNTQAWDATLRTFVTRGDSILVEDY